MICYFVILEITIHSKGGTLKSGLAKKHVFGSSGGCRGGRLPNSCLRVGNLDIFTDIIILEVMFRVSVRSV